MINSTSGFTGGHNPDRRTEWIVPASEVKKGRCVRYIEMSCNDMVEINGTDQSIDPPDVSFIAWARLTRAGEQIL